MSLTDLNLNKNDKLYLILVAVFSFILILYRTKFHMSVAVYYPDKALYLMNALVYSGLDMYNIANPADIFYSPIISFLTSLLFRLGIVDQLAISLVSSFFAFFGFIGLYILLRNRFNPLLSFTGVVIYGSMTELLLNLSSGLLDVPSISISILILLFGIIAIDKNSKYFIVVGLLLPLGFFIRYTVGFMIPILLLYFLMKRNFIENIHDFLYGSKSFANSVKEYLGSFEFKYIILSLILSGILAILICKFLIIDFGGSLSFIQQSANTVTDVNNHVGIDVVYDKLFYIKNFSESLFASYRPFNTSLSILVYLVTGLGLFLKFFDFVRNFDFNKYACRWKSKHFRKLLIIVLFLFIITTVISFKFFSNHIISNICFLASVLIIYSLINEYQINKQKNAFNLLFLSYFAVYFIFLAIYPTKVLRYSLPILPPLIYFIILGLEGILDVVNNKFNDNKDLEIKKEEKINEKRYFGPLNLIPLLLILIFLISSLTFITPQGMLGTSNELLDVVDYINDTDDNYHLKTFASNFHDYRMAKWYLRDNVTFNDDYMVFDSSNVSYIIANTKLDLKNYHEIYNNDVYHLYYEN